MISAMKSLFDKAVHDEIQERIGKLRSDAAREWGKMNVGQMFAHCSATFEVATGQKFPPRTFAGKLLGRIFKSWYTNDKPFSKNGPTDPSFVIADQRDVETERKRLSDLVRQFSEGGAAKCTTHPHSFFGPLTPQEWSIGMYKHMDHHLRQFGG
jgi:hypothetical protein